MLSEKSQQLSNGLRKLLNSHGHAFQYAVIKRGEQLHSERRSKWIFDGAEFPVSVRGETTHVDFILTTRTDRTLLIAECKRADPAKATWCFARAPYTWRDSYYEEVVFERLIQSSGGTTAVRSGNPVHTSEPVYHLGFESRTGQTGDGLGQNTAAINNAVAQVLRSTSGVINHLYKTANFLESSAAVTLVPTVFTTAELWTTDVDLGSADLNSGNLVEASIEPIRKDWIWFTHNRSPSLEPEPDVSKTSGTKSLLGFNHFSDDLRKRFARSVAIVSPSGIDSFLTWNLEEWLY